MRLIMKRNAFFIAVILIAAVFASCQKGDGDVDYGYTYIYMPEATSTGGLSQNYSVPSGYSSSSYNFEIDSINHKLNIILGVSRSGKESSEGYQVDVVVDQDTTNALISSNVIQNGLLLPASIYSIPSSVTVPTGKTSGTFYLSVNSSDLKADAYTDKVLALTVRIKNPNKYSLNTKYSKTIVLIDVNSIRPYLK